MTRPGKVPSPAPPTPHHAVEDRKSVQEYNHVDSNPAPLHHAEPDLVHILLQALPAKPERGKDDHHATQKMPELGKEVHHAAQSEPELGKGVHHAMQLEPELGKDVHHAMHSKPDRVQNVLHAYTQPECRWELDKHLPKPEAVGQQVHIHHAQPDAVDHAPIQQCQGMTQTEEIHPYFHTQDSSSQMFGLPLELKPDPKHVATIELHVPTKSALLHWVKEHRSPPSSHFLVSKLDPQFWPWVLTRMCHRGRYGNSHACHPHTEHLQPSLEKVVLVVLAHRFLVVDHQGPLFRSV